MQRRLLHRPFLPTACVAAAILLGACAGNHNYIAGTKIEQSDENQRVVRRVEEYRAAVEQKDTATLMLMASREYWEDSGTPTGEDDYGFAGLQDVLRTRFQLAESIRYSMRYKRIRIVPENANEPAKAFVDVLIDASFTIPDGRGNLRRTDKRDHGQFVLEWRDGKWLFLSGM